MISEHVRDSKIDKIIRIFATGVVILLVYTMVLSIFNHAYNTTSEKIAQAKQNVLKSTVQFDYNYADCENTEIQVANAFRLASMIEEYNINNIHEGSYSFEITDNEFRSNSTSPKLYTSKKFQEIEKVQECYKIAVISKPSNHGFEVFLTKRPNTKNLPMNEKIYDSGSSEDRKHLDELITSHII